MADQPTAASRSSLVVERHYMPRSAPRYNTTFDNQNAPPSQRSPRYSEQPSPGVSSVNSASPNRESYASGYSASEVCLLLQLLTLQARRCNICTANSTPTNYMYSSKWCHNFTILGQPTTILNSATGIRPSAMNTFFYMFIKCASAHCRLCWYFWHVPITYFFCVMLSNSHVIQNSIIMHRVFHKTALEIWYWIIHIAKFPGRYSQLCWSCFIQSYLELCTQDQSLSGFPSAETHTKDV